MTMLDFNEKGTTALSGRGGGLHATTICAVRRDGKVAMAADGQVSFGATIMKNNAKKLRRLMDGKVICG